MSFKCIFLHLKLRNFFILAFKALVVASGVEEDDSAVVIVHEEADYQARQDKKRIDDH